jgi:hypothetical protein
MITSPAWWQSGYAAACKAAYAGSIPTQASSFAKTRLGGFFVFNELGPASADFLL